MINTQEVTINESSYKLKDGTEAKIAVFIYTGSGDVRSKLNDAVRKYVCGNEHYELIDSSLTTPWVRVVLSNINDMKQETFIDQKMKG